MTKEAEINLLILFLLDELEGWISLDALRDERLAWRQEVLDDLSKRAKNWLLKNTEATK